MTLDGTVKLAAAAGTTDNIRVLLYDQNKDILFATGTDVPVDTSSGYAKGCIFIDRDVATGTTGLYENIGTNTSSVFNAIGAISEGEISIADGKILIGSATGVGTAKTLSQDLTITREGVVTIAKINNLATAAEVNQVCDGNTATAQEIIASSDVSVQASKVNPATAVSGAAAAIKTSVVRSGDIVKTTIFIDLAGLKSVNTAGDIIGDTGVSYIGQVTAAINGTIFKGEINCAEVPTTGDDDIDLYSATKGTGAYDGAIGDLTETAIVNAGGAYAIGTAKPFTAMPAADEYLYLTSGNGDTAGTYDAGQISIEMWGYV